MAAIGVNARVTESLLEHLSKLALNPALPVSYPDPQATFVPPSSGMWLEAAVLRAEAQQIGISAHYETPGILQVTVVAPKGSGPIAPVELADKVADWFRTHPAVYAQPSVAASYQDGATTRTPVTIRYRSFAR